MSDSDDVLKKFSQNDKVLKFDDNGELTGIYQGATSELDPYSTTNETRIAYSFTCPDKQKRMLASKSKRLAKAMYESGAVKGDMLQIMRFGEGYETMYKVKVLTKDKPEEVPAPQEQEEVPDIADF